MLVRNSWMSREEHHSGKHLAQMGEDDFVGKTLIQKVQWGNRTLIYFW